MILVFFMVGTFTTLSAQVMRLRKPDLSIVKITVDRECNLAVVVKNNGPGILPDYVYTKHHPKSAGVYVYINGKGWGGTSIWKFDSAKNLKRPGGMATYISRYKVGAPVDVKAVVDLHNDVKEANERNNTKIRKRLRCGGTGGTRKLPDLIVRDIRLVKGCKIQVSVTNIGTAGVPSSYYDLPNAVGVQMYNGGKPWGGIILKGFDPAGKLKTPGGTATHIWFPNAANLNLGGGTHSIKVVVDNGKVLTELKETNNTLTRRLTCKRLVPAAGIGTSVAVLRKNSVSNIRLSPNSPASLNFNDKVNVWFDYYAREEVYIYARPMTNGSPTPNYAAHGSQLYPKGEGKGQGYFTITKGAVTVNGVRLQMMNKSQNNVLFETIVPVKYKFPKMLIATIPGQVITQIPLKAPDRFIMDFNEAHLIYKPATKTLQVITGNKVLAYGGDWEKCQLKPYLYHLRQKVWKGFYWKVNTSRKEVYKVTGGSFCKLGGSEQKLNITVDTIGGSDSTPPESVFLRFNDAYLVYSVATKSIQIVAQLCVLSYGNDWDKCNLNAYTYHLKNKFAQTFFWKVDTNKKTAVEVTGGTFCKPGGSESPLNCTVRVFN
jgi:hypothetical protein